MPLKKPYAAKITRIIMGRLFEIACRNVKPFSILKQIESNPDTKPITTQSAGIIYTSFLVSVISISLLD
ncbi:MAG: hypothetical protein J6T10_22185 [Methanobrevibacter sp.]|nr:hypothetical protein [Methanobrevibacter sp.]